MHDALQRGALGGMEAPEVAGTWPTPRFGAKLLLPAQVCCASAPGGASTLVNTALTETCKSEPASRD